MTGHSRSKKGVLSHAYVPSVHDLKQDVDARHKACARAGHGTRPNGRDIGLSRAQMKAVAAFPRPQGKGLYSTAGTVRR
jgi:hypothetical protein